MFVAWLGMALASDLPIILWQAAGGTGTPTGLTVAQLAGLAVVWTAAVGWQPTRPVAGFLGLMVSYRLAWSVVLPALHAGDWWQEWLRQPNTNLRQTVTAILPLVAPVLMVPIWIAHRRGWHEAFLGWGDWRRRVLPQWRLTWCGLAAPYNIFILSWLVAGLWLGWRAVDSGLARVGDLLPAILGAAALNALREELEYRVLPLASLRGAVGDFHAVAITSMLFGLAHWYGTPSGPAGVFTTAVGGAVLAASILGTRGHGWALLSHGIGDVVLYTGLVYRNGGFGIG